MSEWRTQEQSVDECQRSTCRMTALAANGTRAAADNARSGDPGSQRKSTSITAADRSAMSDEGSDPRRRPVALITGASRGIGAATARELARRGYTLILAARCEPDLRGIARELETMGSSCHVVPTDLRRKEQVEALAQAALDACGRVDVLIHNAGVAFARHWLLDTYGR